MTQNNLGQEERRHHIKLKLHKAKFRKTECNYLTWTLAKALMLTPLLLKKGKNAVRARKIKKR